MLHYRFESQPSRVGRGGSADVDTTTDGAPRPPGPVAARKQRYEWMDTLRGSAIVLMLVWHATAIPALVGIPVPTALIAVNDALLPFRMPTLMFLSGLLLPAALRKPRAVRPVSS